MSRPRARILLAKPGLDGHDRGARLVARALREAGHEVIYTGLRQTPEAIARAAVDEDVDLVGLSVLAGGHLGLTAKVVERLRSLDARIPVVLGGVIPAEDVPRLLDAGAAGVFPSSMSLDEIVAAVGDLVASGRPANLGL